MTIDPLRLSLLTTLAALALVVPVGLGLASLLVLRRFPGKVLLETLVTLPLVLPPTVVGYGLLLALGRGTAFGRWLNESAHLQLLFTWQGGAVAAAVMALPLFVRTAASALASVDTSLLEAGRLDGAGERVLLLRIVAPLARRGLLAGLLLAAARALGEFGATLMVSGSIPGRTQTLPLALYSAVQSGDDALARSAALWLAGIAFGLVGLVSALTGRLAPHRG